MEGGEGEKVKYLFFIFIMSSNLSVRVYITLNIGVNNPFMRKFIREKMVLCTAGVQENCSGECTRPVYKL